MPLSITINGQVRLFDNLDSPGPLAAVIDQLELKPDRVAVEHNGLIAPRTNWCSIEVSSGDRLEVVHFVGGGNVTPSEHLDRREAREGQYACHAPSLKLLYIISVIGRIEPELTRATASTIPRMHHGLCSVKNNFRVG